MALSAQNQSSDQSGRARMTNHDLDREAQLFAMPYTVYLPHGRVRAKEMRQPLEGELKYSFQGMSLSVLA